MHGKVRKELELELPAVDPIPERIINLQVSKVNREEGRIREGKSDSFMEEETLFEKLKKKRTRVKYWKSNLIDNPGGVATVNLSLVQDNYRDEGTFTLSPSEHKP